MSKSGQMKCTQLFIPFSLLKNFLLHLQAWEGKCKSLRGHLGVNANHMEVKYAWRRTPNIVRRGGMTAVLWIPSLKHSPWESTALVSVKFVLLCLGPHWVCSGSVTATQREEAVELHWLHWLNDIRPSKRLPVFSRKLAVSRALPHAVQWEEGESTTFSSVFPSS